MTIVTKSLRQQAPETFIDVLHTDLSTGFVDKRAKLLIDSVFHYKCNALL